MCEISRTSSDRLLAPYRNVQINRVSLQSKEMHHRNVTYNTNSKWMNRFLNVCRTSIIKSPYCVATGIDAKRWMYRIRRMNAIECCIQSSISYWSVECLFKYFCFSYHVALQHHFHRNDIGWCIWQSHRLKVANSIYFNDKYSSEILALDSHRQSLSIFQLRSIIYAATTTRKSTVHLISMGNYHNAIIEYHLSEVIN